MTRRKFLRSLTAAAFPFLPGFAHSQVLPVQPSSKQSLAERLADYAGELRYEDIDGATVERVKSHLIDALGCGIAAFDENPVRVCREVALAAPGGRSTVIGTRERCIPELASFANGAAIRYYDLNDAYVSSNGTIHPSDHIAACLAVAESEHATVADLITAIVLAYEVNCRLLDRLDAANRGWDLPVLSLPAVALAAGKLMKLTSPKLAQAINLALNDHISMGQTRTQTNSDWKGFADAEAGRNAIFAAALARGGITGPAPVFEGRKGFFQLVSTPAEIDVGAFGGKGRSFKIHECGMKAYPAVVYAQTAIVAGIAAAKQVGNIDHVSSIEIATTPRGYEQAGRDPEKWRPENRDTAVHSLPYITARAMLDGDLNNGSYALEKLRDPRVLALIEKMTVKPDPAFDRPIGNAPSTRITVTLVDGRQITHQVDDMPGFPGKPMRRADVERKFRGNVGERWPGKHTDSVLQSLWALEKVDDVSALLSELPA
jgi:2-methylcitrate dehydratase